MYVFVLLILLLWPLALLGGVALEMEHTVRNSYPLFTDDLHYWWMAWFVMIAVLGDMLPKWNRLQSAFLGPFGVSLKRKWIRTFHLAGLALMLLPACAGVLYYWYLS